MRLLLPLAVLFLALGLPAQAAPDPVPALAQATRSTLELLVSMDTVNPPGNERALGEAVAALLAEDGIESQLLGPEGPRASLLARLPARRRAVGPPLLIVAHVDVVNFDRDAWSTDPLALVEQDGFLYGRGVIDNKGMAAASIEILRELARSKTRLRRDVVLLLAADEEAGGKVGTAWLLREHPELLEAEYVLNEGGDVRIVGDSVAYVGIQTTEKISRRFELVATGQDGHSSMPLPNNAIARLGAAVAEAAELRFEARTTPTTQAFLEGVAPTLGEPLASAAAAVAELQPGEAIPDELLAPLEADPFFGAILRTTCVPTLLEGGTRANALPGRASATMNCRLLPDEEVETVASALRGAAEPHGVELVYSDSVKISPVSPETGPFARALSRASKTAWPGATVVPFMSTGGTDCRRFRLAGAACYGLLPFPLTAEDERRMHGTDERLPVDSLDQGVRFLWELIRNLAA